MANRRMINKSISLSAQVQKLRDQTKILFTWAIPHFDDEGRMRGEPEYVKASVVPLMKWTPKKVDRMIDEICKAGMWERYEVNGIRIIQAIKWLDHQRIQPTRFKPSDLPSKAAKAVQDLRNDLTNRGIIKS